MAHSINPGAMPVFKAGLLPQEEMLETGRKGKQLIIGIPKETGNSDDRVPLTPEAVAALRAKGIR